MTSPMIHVRDLRKVYAVSEREAGVRAALRSLVHRQTENIPAVDGISFDVAPGEMVASSAPTAPARRQR